MRCLVFVLVSFSFLISTAAINRGGQIQQSPLPHRRPRADLVVKGYCSSTEIKTGGRARAVRIVVENIGHGSASTSTTVIAFPDLKSRYTFPTVRIRPGAHVEMYMVIPPRCLAGTDCRFTIWADLGNQVNESDEDNNRRDGRCGGRRARQMPDG